MNNTLARPSLRPSFFCFAVLSLTALSTVLSSGVARADAMKGKVVVSDTAFGTGYSSDAEMAKAIRKQSKTSVTGEGGAWTLNLMVFLKEAPGATSVNIVYYNVTGKREQINFGEVQVLSTQKIVQVNGVAISKELGFVKGHKYEILATRLIGGKEKVYAKGTVTLK